MDSGLTTGLRRSCVSSTFGPLSLSSRVRVYVACSLDGFIAGPGDDLSWLDSGSEGEPGAGGEAEPGSGEGAVGFTQFMSGVGALLMGRRTYDVISQFSGELPYGEVPILVATHRALENGGPTVRPVQGSISEMLQEAATVAEGRDVYVDGGNLVRQALDSGHVHDLIITLVPRVLGQGIPLFAGVTQRCSLEFTGHYRYGEWVQLHARPVS